MITSRSLWAKLKRDDTNRIVRWHSLVDHSADVAAVVEALLAQPILRRRLANTYGDERKQPRASGRPLASSGKLMPDGRIYHLPQRIGAVPFRSTWSRRGS